jgi:hypothetical protein
VRIDNRGGLGSAVLSEAQDEVAFDLCRRRLEETIEEACDREEPWALRTTAAIHAALGFADLDPLATRILTVHAAVRRFESPPAFAAMVDHLACQFGSEAPETRRRSDTARIIVMRIARQVGCRIECDPTARMTDAAPEMIVFALTPYVGFVEAQRWAAWVPRKSGTPMYKKLGTELL